MLPPPSDEMPFGLSGSTKVMPWHCRAIGSGISSDRSFRLLSWMLRLSVLYDAGVNLNEVNFPV